MSPEDLFTHGTPKSAIEARLGALLQDTGGGLIFIDKTRLSCPRASRSAEPSILVLLHETLGEEVKLVRAPKESGAVCFRLGARALTVPR